MNQGDVPSVVEKLKEKLEHWKSDQDRKTKESIAKAQKEIDRLEAEAEANGTSSTSTAKDAASKPAQALDSVNGDASAGAELAQEDDAVAGAASELEKAKIEDAES
ncbi:hypothetical protein LTR28_012641 [Elasticomyces elasticus]|nr:hypothetical protein LTR28_012641 [Elasticomyces elasticus]